MIKTKPKPAQEPTIELEADSQCKIVRDHLLAGKRITQRQANGLGIYRLASRINDLRYGKSIWPPMPYIHREMVEVTKANGKTVKVAQYSMPLEKINKGK